MCMTSASPYQQGAVLCFHQCVVCTQAIRIPETRLFSVVQCRSLPSTCKENHGNIIYMVEAKLVRSWKMTRTLERELKFVSKANSDRLTLMVCTPISTQYIKN